MIILKYYNMEKIVKTLFDNLENRQNPYYCIINREAKEFIINTLKAEIDEITGSLLDKVRNKDHLIMELEEKGKATAAINKDLIEQIQQLRAKNFKLEDENFSLKKRIKLLLTLSKNNEMTYKDKTPIQYKASSSLKSEGNEKCREQSSYSPSLRNYDQLNDRIKALEKGVNNILDSPTLRPSPDKQINQKLNAKCNSNSSLIRSDKTNPLSYSSNILTFNPAYMRKSVLK